MAIDDEPSEMRRVDRTYKAAVELLDTYRRNGRPTVEAVFSAGVTRMPNVNGASEMKGTASIVGMKDWLLEIGHTTADVDRLNIIHVAGTKGKGSTCVFTEALLRAHGLRTGFPSKTGLYTSPHLLVPEERIRLNFQPLARQRFADYFFEVHAALRAVDEDAASARVYAPRPKYLQLLALLAMHAFIREGVDAAIIETHHGGEYDSTNVVTNPVVTAVTPLGLDHIKQLGPSIENIAWHKAGIFKPAAAALSAPQDPSPARVLRQRAADKGAAELQFASADDPALPRDALQLEPGVQRANAALALAAARAFLARLEPKSSISAEDITTGIASFTWPGRFQLITRRSETHALQTRYFLDGAHNELSIGCAAAWFQSLTYPVPSRVSAVPTGLAPILPSRPPIRVLIYSQISDQRDGGPVFSLLANVLANPASVSLSTSSTSSGDPSPNPSISTTSSSSTVSAITPNSTPIHTLILTTYKRDTTSLPRTRKEHSTEMPSQQLYLDTWKAAHPDADVVLTATIEEALQAAQAVGERASTGEGGVVVDEPVHLEVLLTGSLYLVGGALSLLQQTALEE